MKDVILTTTQVRSEVERILALTDTEERHVEEDKLARRVVTAIAQGRCIARPCCVALLKLLDSDHERWYA